VFLYLEVAWEVNIEQVNENSELSMRSKESLLIFWHLSGHSFKNPSTSWEQSQLNKPQHFSPEIEDVIKIMTHQVKMV
jgi:hypothetical protein